MDRYRQSVGRFFTRPAGRHLGAVLGLALATPVVQVSAQTEQTLELEEVVVTARKREESLQDTPIAVTAFDSETLGDTNMQDLRDIGKFTPGMSFTSYGMGSSEAGAMFIRGVGQSDHMITTDPGVGLYIDGVYVGRNQGAALDILDLERVEVLKGPQGTLFGKNTIGGAVNVVSRRPTFENTGYVDLKAGTDGRLDLNATGELAASDDLAFRISVLSKQRDGVGEQIFTGDEAGNEDSLGLRALAYWQGETASFSLVVDNFSADQGAVPHTLYEHGTFLASQGGGPCFQRTAPGTYAACTGEPEIDPYINYSLNDLSTEQKTFGVSGTWEWDLRDDLQFKSITAQRSMEYVGNLEFDGAPDTIVYYHETGEAEQFSQEFQLLGETKTFDWITGFYYFSEEGHNLQDDDEFGSLNRRFSEVETSSIAAFAQATMPLSDVLNLTAGARYTQETKDYNVYRQSIRTGTELVASQEIYSIPPTELDDSWNAVSGTLGLDFKVSDDVLLYGKYSRGFRSGGFNARVSTPVTVNIYDPEYVNVFEVGLKSELMDRRLRLNLAAYRTAYEDYQAQVNEIANAFSTRTLNAAKASVTGLELEFTAILSPWLNLDGGFGYTDATIDETDIPALLRANFKAGHVLPYTSETTYSLSPHAYMPVGDGTLSFRLDYAYRSSFFGQISNHPQEEEDGYGLVNVQVRYQPTNEKWSVAFYGINLTDEQYTRVRNYYSGFVGFALWNTDVQEFGLKARYNF